MEVERQPLKRMQADADILARRKGAWQDLNRSLTTLREGARALYGFENPFNERIVDSSDAKAITATATRQAIDEKLAVAVRRIATADRFLSSPLARDYAVAAGEYVFSVGGKEVRLAYGGGSLRDFADAITRKGGDLVQASVVNDTKDTQVLLVESRKTGCREPPALLGCGRGPRRGHRHARAPDQRHARARARRARGDGLGETPRPDPVPDRRRGAHPRAGRRAEDSRAARGRRSTTAWSSSFPSRSRC